MKEEDKDPDIYKEKEKVNVKFDVKKMIGDMMSKLTVEMLRISVAVPCSLAGS